MSAAPVTKAVIHYGPVWKPRPALGYSFAFCRAAGTQIMSAQLRVVTCPACLKLMAQVQAQEGGLARYRTEDED